MNALATLRTAVAATLVMAAPSSSFPTPQPVPPDPPQVFAQVSKDPLLLRSGSFLGVGVAEVDAARAKALNLKEERGVEVTRVEEDSPASKGGLKTGDVVMEFNGQRVEGVAQFRRMVQETPSGREVKLAIIRAGSPETISVRPEARKMSISRLGEGGSFEMPAIRIEDVRIPDLPRAHMSWRNSSIGIEAETLDSQLAEYFGVKEGVLVRSVAKGSAAEKAGIKAGDVIVKVEDSRVSSPREIASAIQSARSRKTVPFHIVREKKDMSLTVTIEENYPLAMPRR